MSKKTAKEKKLRRKKNQEEKVKSQCIQFDIIQLLQDSNLTTKPEVGEFLKKYVKSIRVLNMHSKLTIYPIQSYDISKVFIDFLDGHQIIIDYNTQPNSYFLYDKIEEVQLKDKDLSYIIHFADILKQFSFIH